MKESQVAMQTLDIDHLGIVAGIIDCLGIGRRSE
jgi:hypothetical protein